MTDSEKHQRRSPRLAGQVMWSGGALALPTVVLLGLTPYLLQQLGPERFGLWSLLATLLLFGVSLDGGLSASVLRWAGIYKGVDERAFVTRIVTTVLLTVSAVAGLIAAAIWLCIKPLSGLVNASDDLRADTELILRSAPALVCLAILSSVFAAFAQAHGRFTAQFIRALVSQAAFVVAAVTLVPAHGLTGVVGAAFIQQGVGLVVAAAISARYLRLRSVAVMRRSELGPFARHAGQVQLGGLSTLLILEGDLLVVTLLRPIDEVGVYALGAAVAGGLRSIPLFAVPPVYSRQVDRFRREGLRGSLEAARSQQMAWSALTVPWSFFTVAVSFAAVTAWVGPQAGLAGLVALILSVSYALNTATAVMSTFCRAIGRPGLETTYSAIAAVVNIALIFPLTLWLGVVGASIAGAFAYAVGIVTLLRLVRRKIDTQFPAPIRVRDLPQPVAAAVVAGVSATFAVTLLPQGVIGLAITGAVAAVPFVPVVVRAVRLNTHHIKALS
ncbi:polysaccharide biosynthesis C-terminal domain-containing protein [Modestobacter sp. L9-4]|uniref:lipopolysaccharide biosynthesis protein n=1 Tax=Modestobacter sp. L9-4 TaxID=2851567 RepID=UPI001C76FC1E|nr:polysaccharide biosynthesis C-terminal domain-containing protein [Modestobacter sp. L9-4]QXG74627.1 polysaccharide biosynthesis C-terminal domain-containing protein [Modestobacter sp. L9-4]